MQAAFNLLLLMYSQVVTDLITNVVDHKWDNLISVYKESFWGIH
jgi:hypothetical protein